MDLTAVLNTIVQLYNALLLSEQKNRTPIDRVQRHHRSPIEWIDTLRFTIIPDFFQLEMLRAVFVENGIMNYFTVGTVNASGKMYASSLTSYIKRKVCKKTDIYIYI